MEPKSIIRDRVNSVEAQPSGSRQLKSGREFTFEAPMPRSLESSSESHVRKVADAQAAYDDQSDEVGFEGLFRETSDAAADSSMPEVRDPESVHASESVEPRLQLERTGSVKDRDQAPPANESTNKSVELDGILLPRERSGNSGSTPQWAGFPGQKKLF